MQSWTIFRAKLMILSTQNCANPIQMRRSRLPFFQMGPTKAPGPDGFPALFYQTHWDFQKDEICDVVRCFLGGRSIPEGFCDSVIVVIPKVVRPKHLQNFHPISLCNVLYKITSKVLANKLKLFLLSILSEHQSAFVPGRWITDNALIALECLHTIRQQRVKQPHFALKIDMTKAYDPVEWSYLHGCWVNLVLPLDGLKLSCVVSHQFVILWELIKISLNRLFLREVSANGIPLVPICSFSALKVCLVCFGTRKRVASYKDYGMVARTLQSHTYSSLMSAFSLLEVINEVSTPWRMPWLHIVMARDKR